MKVLLTGGAGFIGSNFADLLVAEGHTLSIFDDFNDFYDPAIKRANIAGLGKGVPIYQADLRDWNAVERAVLLAPGPVIELNDLPPRLRRELPSGSPDSAPALPASGIDLRSAVESYENGLIKQALEKTGRNKNRAAQLLGLNRTTLVEIIKRRNL